MFSKSDPIRSTLHRLETACADAEERLLVARRFCDDDLDLDRCLETLALRRRSIRRWLKAELRARGGSPGGGTSLQRDIRRVLTATKSAFVEDSVQAQLEECHRGAYFLVRDFERAVEEDLPSELRAELVRWLRPLREDLATLRKLHLDRSGAAEQRGVDPGESTASSADAMVCDEESGGRMESHGRTATGSDGNDRGEGFLVAELRKALLVQRSSLPLTDRSSTRGVSPGQLLVVADGIGPRSLADEASVVALEELRRYTLNEMPWFLHMESADRHRLHRALRHALQASQDRIREIDASRPSNDALATTLTLAYVLWPQVHVVHAGDCRAYLQRGDRLERVTSDHTHDLPAAESRRERLWNVIGGSDESLEVDVHEAELRFGDTLLLCSKGLTSRVGEPRILEVLQEDRSVESLTDRLVNEALDVDGSESVTVVLGRFEAAGSRATQKNEARLDASVANADLRTHAPNVVHPVAIP